MSQGCTDAASSAKGLLSNMRRPARRNVSFASLSRRPLRRNEDQPIVSWACAELRQVNPSGGSAD
jgi:hypothetical protein